MREVVPQLRLRRVRFRSGERFPVLIDKQGIPLSGPVSYIAIKRHLSVNTLDSKVRTLGLVHDFLDGHGIDLRARVARASVLEYMEAIALRDHLRRIGRRTEAILTRLHLEGAGVEKGDIVEPAEWYRRRRCAAAYLKWLVNGLIRELELSSDDYMRVSAEIEKACDLIVDGGRPRAKPAPTALTPDQRAVLLEAILPKSPTNPFPETFQIRNFVLIATYWETGLRRSEVLGLRKEDISPIGELPTLKLIRRPDASADTRARTASVKTMPRAIPITKFLHERLNDYIENHRRLVEVQLKERRDKVGLRRFELNPYIFVSSRGTAISVSSVFKIFETLRMSTNALPGDLSPHVLRRTWNDMFSEMSRDAAMGSRESVLRELLMGWVQGSVQSVRYSRQSTEREANRAILTLQQQWMASWSNSNAS